MADWFKKIHDFISLTKIQDEATALTIDAAPSSAEILSKTTPKLGVTLKTLFEPLTQTNFTRTNRTTHAKGKLAAPNLVSQVHKGQAMTSKTEREDNLKALKKLRALPRGTQVESRIAAIENLLGQHEVFKTLNMLRWPQGVICPHCHSTNVVKREAPKNAPDARHHYVCLNCKEDGNPSDFDDFSGLPISSVHALRQWILCWYLIGFCSINQIAKVLGLSIAEVIEMAKHGSELTELPRAEEQLKSKQEYATKERKAREDARISAGLEEDKRSFSKSPTKPGPKSKL